MHLFLLIVNRKKKQSFRCSQTKNSIHTRGRIDISSRVISNARTEKPF